MVSSGCYFCSVTGKVVEPLAPALGLSVEPVWTMSRLTVPVMVVPESAPVNLTVVVPVVLPPTMLCANVAERQRRRCPD